MKTITRLFFLFIIICLFSTTVHAQNTVVDSLSIELQNHPSRDSTRVNLLNSLAFSYFNKDLPKTLEYLEEANAIAEVINFKKGKARSIYIKGITESIQGNYDQALYHYDKALKLYEKIPFKKGVASCYNAMGITFKNKGELRKSVSYYKEAIKIEEEIGSNNLSASLLNLGTCYEVLGEFDNAITYLKKSLSIAKAEENEQRIAYSLNNLGTVYSSQGNYKLAIEHYNESLYILKKLGDSISIANNFSNIADIYVTQQSYDKAMDYHEKSLGIFERINNKPGVCSALNGIGIIHEKNGNFKRALDYYVEALSISKQIGSNSDTPHILYNIGEIYLALKDYEVAIQYFRETEKISLEIGSKEILCGAYIGLSKTYTIQKEHDKALKNALKVKEIAKTLGFLDYQKEASEVLSNIYKEIGDYKHAFENYQQFKILNDSLFNKKNIEKITQLEYEYKYKQALDSASIKELKLTKTIKDTSQSLKKSQRTFLVSIIIFLLISILLGGIIFYLKFRNIKAQTHGIIVEQKLLRSQMTPHFIFNSLSVLQGMILNKEQKKSVVYLSKFSKLLRIILENSRDKIVPLSQELEAVENYLSLQNLENDSYTYAVSVDDTVDTEAFEIPPMLIQPFVENAIEHAFTNQLENREIQVRLTYQDQKLICTITDNGVGIHSQPITKRSDKNSLATTITSERLQILSKDFNREGSVTIENRQKYDEQGTLVTLIIPYVKTHFKTAS